MPTSTNPNVPNSQPLVFRELQGVTSYAELIEVLNFNFSRIANSPYFRGKLGSTGAAGLPGINGLRGNHIYYADINRVNAELGTNYDLVINKFDAEALNLAYTTQNTELKLALLADIFVQHDWCLLPDGSLCILYDLDANDPSTSEWLDTGLKFLTSSDDTLISLIVQLINDELSTKTLGVFKTYDVGFNIVADDASNIDVGIANIAAGSTAGGLSPILDIAGPTTTNNLYYAIAINNATVEQTRSPIMLGGKYSDYYEIIKRTLPLYGQSHTASRNINYTPNVQSLPSNVFMQYNYNNGIMIGHVNDTLQKFASIYKTSTGLAIAANFSWNHAANNIYDKFVASMFLGNGQTDMSYVRAHKYAIQTLRNAAASTAFHDAIIFDTNAADKPRAEMHDELEVILPGYAANGLIVANNRTMTVVDTSINKRKVLTTSATGTVDVTPGIARTLVGYDVNGDYTEIPYPLDPAYVNFDFNQIAHIKHIHNIPAIRSWNNDMVDVAADGLLHDTSSIIILPDLRPVMPDSMKLLVHVEIPIAAQGIDTSMFAARLKTLLAYQVQFRDSNFIGPDAIVSGTNIIQHTGIATTATITQSSLSSYMSKYHATYLIEDIPGRVAQVGTTIPTTIIFRVQTILEKLLPANVVDHIYVGSPIVTAIPLVTDIGINRQNTPDPDEPVISGLGTMKIIDTDSPSFIDFVVS